MRPLALKIWNQFRRQRQAIRGPKPAARTRWRPCLEALEDRLAPATSGFSSTAPAVLTGIVYVDTNNNGIQDPGELAVPGATVTLTGTTSQGVPVAVSTATDANGHFIFFQVQPGTYSLVRSPLSTLVDGQSSIGNLGGTIGNDAISVISVAEGQTALNYNFAVRGLAPKQVSLRQFLSSTTKAQESLLLPSPGAGFTAADNSVQPTTPATPGTSSLAGSVLGSASNGMRSVQVALTGIDISGRAIFQTATTDQNGAYQFTALQPGTYTLNVTSQPSGFRVGQPTPGSLGGFVFRNGQIIDIQVAAGVTGINYNFTELPTPAPQANAGLAITAVLADDTAGPKGTTSDGITSDPSIQGSIAGQSPIVSFRGGFDATPAANFADLRSNLTLGGAFFLNPALLVQVAGGSLANGPHTLHLQAANAQGQVANFTVSFTLQALPPAQPTLHLDSQSDPRATGITTSSTVTLQGQTSLGVQVALLQGGKTLKTTTANAVTGAFSFSNITLASGPNDFTVQATDAVGNTSQFQTFFVKENPPVAAATSPVNEFLTRGGADQFVNLSSRALFTDADLSDSLVRFNTSAGPINVELFDAKAPQTVANFFSYIAQGAYNNDIFHRLATGFVLQGGGFTFNTGSHTITSVAAGPTILNEFDNSNRPNVVGTLAMAKLGGNPNSATSQFFFNLADNTRTLGASNNGGFTVFGKVVSGADQRVLNTLAAASVVDQSSFNSAFNTLPLNNYSGTKFPTDTTAANYDLINSITVLRQTEQLTYSIVSNSDTNGSIVTASISFGQLDLHAVGQGTATVVVKATDKAGQSATTTFSVTVS